MREAILTELREQLKTAETKLASPECSNPYRYERQISDLTGILKELEAAPETFWATDYTVRLAAKDNAPGWAAEQFRAFWTQYLQAKQNGRDTYDTLPWA